jgi:hypothetical protein
MATDSLPSILQIVAAHPWIDAEQISALAGLSHRQTDRTLGQALREGLTQVCHVAGLCTHGALYAPRRRTSNIECAAGTVNLERALLQIEPLWGARNLLAHLVQRETLLRSCSPARLSLPAESTLAQDGSHHARLDVLAWGTLKRDNELLPFVIEWDLGEVVPEAYRDRFAAVHRITQQCEPSLFPVWAMVTTNRVRLTQLLWLWREAALRHHMRPLRFYIAEWSAVISGQPDVWRRIGTEGMRVCLFQGEPGQTIFPLGPQTAQSLRAGFSADRVLNGQTERHGLARAHLSVPNRFTRRVLRSVANWPLLSLSEAALLLSDEHETNVRSALRNLVKLGLIAEYLRPQEPTRYYLTLSGVQLLAAASGVEPGRYVHYRRWPTKTRPRGPAVHSTRRRKELDIGILVRHFQHTRDVRAFMVSLANVARRYRKLRFDHALMVWDESECRRYYQAEGRRRALVPDSGGVYRIGQDAYEFFLEIDRGTMSRKKLARKFDCYYTYRQTGEYLHGGTRLPRLLVIVPDEGRAHLVRKVILERAKLAGLTPLDAWIAVQDTLNTCGPAAPVWRHIVDWKMSCCFAGFENADQMPRPLNLAPLSRDMTSDMHKARTIRKRRASKGTS